MVGFPVFPPVSCEERFRCGPCGPTPGAGLRFLGFLGVGCSISLGLAASVPLLRTGVEALRRLTLGLTWGDGVLLQHRLGWGGVAIFSWLAGWL